MKRTPTKILAVLAVASVAVAGCGETEEVVERTSKVSGAQRIERCIEQYPDSTKADCEQWEADEEIGDDGTHRNHDG